MIETIQKQEAELLRELRQKTDTKLKVLEEELEIVDFYVTKAYSLQVNILYGHTYEMRKNVMSN